MKKSLLSFIVGSVIGAVFFYIAFSSSIWYDGFYQFCRHAPAQPGVAQSPPMYYENECKEMLQQAKDIGLYHNLIIPTPTLPSAPQG